MKIIHLIIDILVRSSVLIIYYEYIIDISSVRCNFSCFKPLFETYFFIVLKEQFFCNTRDW
jgi:hypothetical protein